MEKVDKHRNNEEDSSIVSILERVDSLSENTTSQGVLEAQNIEVLLTNLNESFKKSIDIAENYQSYKKNVCFESENYDSKNLQTDNSNDYGEEMELDKSKIQCDNSVQYDEDRKWKKVLNREEFSWESISVQTRNKEIEVENDNSGKFYDPDDPDNITYEESELRIIKCCLMTGALMVMTITCILISTPIVLKESQQKVVIPMQIEYCKFSP